MSESQSTLYRRYLRTSRIDIVSNVQRYYRSGNLALFTPIAPDCGYVLHQGSRWMESPNETFLTVSVLFSPYPYLCLQDLGFSVRSSGSTQKVWHSCYSVPFTEITVPYHFSVTLQEVYPILWEALQESEVASSEQELRSLVVRIFQGLSVWRSGLHYCAWHDFHTGSHDASMPLPVSEPIIGISSTKSKFGFQRRVITQDLKRVSNFNILFRQREQKGITEEQKGYLVRGFAIGIGPSNFAEYCFCSYCTDLSDEDQELLSQEIASGSRFLVCPLPMICNYRFETRPDDEFWSRHNVSFVVLPVFRAVLLTAYYLSLLKFLSSYHAGSEQEDHRYSSGNYTPFSYATGVSRYSWGVSLRGFFDAHFSWLPEFQSCSG